MKEVNDLVVSGKIVSLTIDVTEEVTEKEEKQEVLFETVEAVTLEKPVKEKKKKATKKRGSSSFKSKKK
jgi:hypothetical protein